MDPNATPDDTLNNEDSLPNWFRENRANLLTGAAVLGLVLYYLHPLDVALAAAGLTLIIFLHELGHFAAAKLCRVRVETFSIGFGPAIPGCKFKYGETTYKLAVIPLGGFVKMLGEGENAEGEEAENDPRSFKNQSVPERMLIISAGVIMNLILAFVLFVVVYMHGLPEQPALVASLEPGGALWRHNVHTGSRITAIGGRTGLFFDDVRPIVWGTDAGDKLEIALSDRGETSQLSVEPLYENGAPFPLLGFRPPESLILRHHPRDNNPPYYRGSPAEAARQENGDIGFRPGDRITAMTDPDDPRKVKPFATGEDTVPSLEFEQRMMRLAGQEVRVVVERMDAMPNSQPVTIILPPAFRYETGARMRIGPITAVREGAPAQIAGLRSGDRIVELHVENPDGTRTVYAADAADAMAKFKEHKDHVPVPLDPLRLPWLLREWARTAAPAAKIRITALRGVNHSDKRETFELIWDRRGADDTGEGGSPNSPVAINGLGLAYSVQAVVDGVRGDVGGLQPGDTIEAVRFHSSDADGQVKIGEWDEVKPGQWAFVDRQLQTFGPHILEVRASRNGVIIEARLTGVADTTCPVTDRGLIFLAEYHIQKANGIGEALEMGVNRTIRMIKSMYINLYAMAFGRVSAVQTMSGPITLARLSYKIAGESSYKLLLLLALISINLAVVNFLPIPMLDGGHMMFLIYEAIVGRPPPERVHFWLSMLGLSIVLSLMVFVIGLDLWRLVQAWPNGLYYLIGAGLALPLGYVAYRFSRKEPASPQ